MAIPEITKPVKMWVQNALPLVFDDSLSYYEVLAKFTTYINKLIDDVSELAGSIGDYDSDIAELRTELSDVNSEIDNIKNDIQNVESDMSGINERINGVVTRVDSIESTITSINNSVSNLQNDVESLNDRVTTAETSVANLGQAVNEVETAVSDVVSTQTLQENRISALEENVNDVDQNINTLQTTVGQHGTDISTLQTTVGQHGTDISMLQTTVEQHETDISTLQTTVGQHGTDISTLQTNVNSNTQNIQNQESGLSDLKSAFDNTVSELYDNGYFKELQVDKLADHYTISRDGEITASAERDTFVVHTNLVKSFIISGYGSKIEIIGYYASYPAVNSIAIDNTRHTDVAWGEITVPTGCNYLVCVLNTNNNNYINAVSSNKTIADIVTEMGDDLTNSGNLLTFGGYHKDKYYTDEEGSSESYCYFSVDVIFGHTYYIAPGFRFLSKESQTIINYTVSTPYTYTADYTGKLYVTFYKSTPGWIVTELSDYRNVRPFDIPDFFKNALLQELGTNETRAMSQKGISDSLVGRVGSDTRNLLELPVEFVPGKYYNHSPETSAAYDYFIINVVSGTTYHIGPRLRYLCKEGQSYFVQNQNDVYDYTADYSGPLYVTFFHEDRYKWKITTESYASVKPYKPLDKVLDTFGTRFVGKKILNIGDSIAENRNDSISYSHQFSEQTGAILATDYALGGSTLSLIENQEMGCIYSQALRAISEHPSENYDIIMVDGGANDNTQGRTVGSVVGTTGQYEPSDYTATFDTSTVAGAVEEIFKLLRNQYLSSIIVFVIPHKHGRHGATWEAILTAIRNACDKWSIAVLDMDKNGELNTRITAMRTDYTDEGGTHPNTLGIKTFYLPKLIGLLDNYFVE